MDGRKIDLRLSLVLSFYGLQYEGSHDRGSQKYPLTSPPQFHGGVKNYPPRPKVH